MNPNDPSPTASNSDADPLPDEAVAALFAAARRSDSIQRVWEPPTIAELQRLLPQYLIRDLIGRGGMGAVYRGLQRSLDREVAIKILPPGTEDDDSHFPARFKQEAKAMARLSHPGIVAVFDAGETPEGLLYFVMEYIEGTDVRRMVADRGTLPFAEALPIVASVCDALQFAHESGLLHRDIKPANIMVDFRGQVKVADFGLAKTASLESGGLTVTNMVMGTPDFVAPEAFFPEVQLDQRADIYAVGVMLYQMLTGHIPRGRFALPSGCVPNLDPRLDAIVDKALQTDRDRRYTTARELRADLDRIAALPPSVPVSAAPRFCKRATGLAALAVLLVGGVALYLGKVNPGGNITGGRPAAAADVRELPAIGSAPWPKVTAGNLPIYPVGKWTRCWTADVEDREVARKDGDWLRLKQDGGGSYGAPMMNGGIRVRGRGQAPKDQSFLQLHVHTGLNLNLFIDQFTGADFYLRENREPGGLVELVHIPLRDGLRPGPKEYVMELYIIGTTLIGRVNGQTLAVQTAIPPKAGGFGFSCARVDFLRDLEILNLDGLPEAEAMKLIGFQP